MTDQLDIIIRGQEADDWEDVAEILAGTNVVHHTLQLPFQSRDKIRDKVENPRPNLYVLVAEVDEQVIGLLGVDLWTGRRARTAHLGMMVHVDFQGQGVGSALMEAAIDLAENWLNCTRIELSVFTDNEAGIALYRKYGFEVEGTLRDYAVRAGRYDDVYLMARLRKDAS